MTTPHDDPERDPWLSHALRHAPDANAAPSPELSDAILRSARNAVKQKATQAASRPEARGQRRWMQWWSWLARPPVAAGFATVMVAVLVGVMWIDKPIDEALPDKVGIPAEPPAREAAPTPAPAPAPTPAPAPPVDAVQDAAKKAAAPPATREPEAKRRDATPPAAARPAPAPKRERGAEQSTIAAPAAAPTPVPEPRAPSPFTDNTSRPAEQPAAQGAAPAAAARAPAPPPAPAAAPAQARDEATAERRSTTESSAGVLAKSAPAPNTVSALRAQREGSGAAPFVIDAPERWRWQRGGEPQAMTPALQAWVDQLHRSARWRPAGESTPTAGEAEVLVLWRDGAPYATIQIGTDAARLTLRGRPPLTAPLTPTTSAALTSSLLAATR